MRRIGQLVVCMHMSFAPCHSDERSNYANIQTDSYDCSNKFHSSPESTRSFDVTDAEACGGRSPDDGSCRFDSNVSGSLDSLVER